MTQAECRETVRILELKAELARLVSLRERREAKAQLKLCRETVDAVKVSVRADGMCEYATLDGEKAGVEMASVRRHASLRLIEGLETS